MDTRSALGPLSHSPWLRKAWLSEIGGGAIRKKCPPMYKITAPGRRGLKTAKVLFASFLES